MMHLYIDMKRQFLHMMVFGAWLGVGYAEQSWGQHETAFADHEA